MRKPSTQVQSYNTVHVLVELTTLQGARFAVVRYGKELAYTVARFGKCTDCGPDPKEWHPSEPASPTLAAALVSLHQVVEWLDTTWLRGHN